MSSDTTQVFVVTGKQPGEKLTNEVKTAINKQFGASEINTFAQLSVVLTQARELVEDIREKYPDSQFVMLHGMPIASVVAAEDAWLFINGKLVQIPTPPSSTP